MSKPMLVTTLATAVCLATATAASASRNLSSKHTPTAQKIGQKLTLEIAGAEGPQTAAELQQAFAANGVHASVRPGKKSSQPLKLVAPIDLNTDLSLWSRAITTLVPNRAGHVPPALELVLYAPLTSEGAAPLVAQLQRIKGVDARNSTIDVKKGVLRVRISGTDHVTAADIEKAVKQAGVAPHFAKTTRTRKY
ncbi:MAG TPA: hypothetical protein VFW73_02570 [Lacipirellulaceae bacterium]|nr:hypothetical protein [Lacipirellulaceae bacterium]